ncbi:winged helix-turn-helix domain-containing protein [Bradyrhizobium sp.]|jgi:TolB-like protein|uniref:winged helix-turn-helix domain-containing protein n=1 Tax=Bradyrhizobium sp. TaxID=376 RepID=UPI002DFFE000|nr:winged helix-turn-helix domain-containing protein [Bradyrhizobium sp.]
MLDRTLTFGRFSLDPRGGLMSGARSVRLTPKALALLSFMAGRPGEVIGKEELFGAVWPEVTVGDAALVTCIQELRKALGDDARRPRYIETLHRRGYRFIGKLAAAALPAATDDKAGALALPDRPSIAVLPFANMSEEADQEYFADGISEDLITGLARIHWLFVIARNSSFVYKDRAVDVKQVSRELGVRYVLEGSVRRAGKRIRISAQLIDAVTGGHHWAERYDRELGDIFAVQDEITRNVVAAIEPRLLAAEGIRALSRSAGDLGAWERVARAQTHVWRLTRADYATAIEGLTEAVEAYPDYAPARSRLAFRLLFAAHMGWVDRDAGLHRGREHAIRAVALDDCDSWGQTAVGYLAMMERRTEPSLAAFRRAVELNPNSATTHGDLSRGLAFAGHDREAIAHAEHAIRLSPMDPDMALFLGGIAVAHYGAGRYAEAVQVSEQISRLRPGFQGAQRLHCASLAQSGRTDEARAYLEIVKREQPQLSIEWIRGSVPYQTEELMERFLQGMRKAGLE